jgi:hypothetical protein
MKPAPTRDRAYQAQSGQQRRNVSGPGTLVKAIWPPAMLKTSAGTSQSKSSPRSVHRRPRRALQGRHRPRRFARIRPVTTDCKQTTLKGFIVKPTPV